MCSAGVRGWKLNQEVPMQGRSIALAATVTALLLPVTAAAGGWATVGLSSTPDGLPAGKPWVVDLEVLQHGRTPLEGITPSIVVTDRAGAKQTIAARPTGQPGIYRARVVFPRPGEYEYVVDDGFSQQHSYPPVRVGTPAATSPPPPAPADESPWAAFAASLVAGALAAAGTALVQRRRRGGVAEGTG
jgi:hypothetical protein